MFDKMIKTKNTFYYILSYVRLFLIKEMALRKIDFKGVKNMQSVKMEMNVTIKNEKFLDSREWDAEWEECLGKAKPYVTKTDLWPIHAILPIPGRKESLIIHGDSPYEENLYSYSIYKTRSTLLRSQDGLSVERLALRLTMDNLDCFQKRLHPLILEDGALFPTEAPDHAIWLNPASICDIQEKEPGKTLISMTNGLGVCVKQHKETIEKYTANALLALACTHRDLYLPNQPRSVYPLDYVVLYNNSFTRMISQHKLLQTFPIEPREFRDEYFQHGATLVILDTLKRSEIVLFDYQTIYDLVMKYKKQ